MTSLGCEYRAHIRCDDGLCAGRNVRTGRSLCLTSLTCPSHRPYLCPDYSCAAHPFYCPSIQFCPEGTYTCSDYSCSTEPCVEEESMCPVSRPVKCDDGQCVTTILDCRNMEGCMAPYECFLSSSLSLADQCFDGSCVLSYQSCPRADCDALAAELGLPIPLSTCWNGECLVEGTCPPLPSCPLDYPVRCPDGTCQKSAQLCTPQGAGDAQGAADSDCPAGTTRCRSGECREVCYGVNGCGVSEGMCPNGVCVPLIPSDFTGETEFSQRCPTTCRAGGGRKPRE